MAGPWMIPAAVGAVGGAVMNKDDPLQGALLGGALGGVGGHMLGGLGGAAVPSLVSQVPGAAGMSLASTAAPASAAMGLSAPGLLGGSAGDFAGLGAAQLGSPAMGGMAPVTNLAVHGAPQQMGMMDALKSSGQALGEVMGSGGGSTAEKAMMMAQTMGGGEEPQQPMMAAPPPPINPGPGESFAAQNPYIAQKEDMLRRMQMGSGLLATSRMI